jgi:hypothetical protein
MHHDLHRQAGVHSVTAPPNHALKQAAVGFPVKWLRDDILPVTQLGSNRWGDINLTVSAALPAPTDQFNNVSANAVFVGVGMKLGAVLRSWILSPTLDSVVQCSSRVRCAFFGRTLHSRMPLVPTPLLRLKLLHACAQWHSSRKFTALTGWHCKLCPNTKGATDASGLLLAMNTTTWWLTSGASSAIGTGLVPCIVCALDDAIRLHDVV